MIGSYPIPDIQDAFNHLRRAKYFAMFDLLITYWQLGLSESYREICILCKKGSQDALRHFRGTSVILPTNVDSLVRLVEGDLLVLPRLHPWPNPYKNCWNECVLF